MASVELAVDRILGRRVALELMHAEYQGIPLAVHRSARICRLSADEVLKILRQYGQFEIVLTTM